MPASVGQLARQYAEPISVVWRDDVPDRFRWRGRQYVVRTVLDHWLLTAAWWESPYQLDTEWEYWRLAATAGPARSVVVDLCLSTATGEWFLHRLFD